MSTGLISSIGGAIVALIALIFYFQERVVTSTESYELKKKLYMVYCCAGLLIMVIGMSSIFFHRQ